MRALLDIVKHYGALLALRNSPDARQGGPLLLLTWSKQSVGTQAECLELTAYAHQMLLAAAAAAVLHRLTEFLGDFRFVREIH